MNSAALNWHYLDHLVRMEQRFERHPSKRVNWLKFCHRCGTEISSLPKRVVYCGECREAMASRRS